MIITGAVGILEVAGLPAAITCADAALKAADVTLIGYEVTNGGPGLVTVKLTGNVSAVKAAVEAGTAAAGELTQAHGTIVLARPHESLESVLLNTSKGTVYTKAFKPATKKAPAKTAATSEILAKAAPVPEPKAAAPKPVKAAVIAEAAPEPVAEPKTQPDSPAPPPQSSTVAQPPEQSKAAPEPKPEPVKTDAPKEKPKPAPKSKTAAPKKDNKGKAPGSKNKPPK